MNTRQIGPFAVAEVGLGCMNLSHAYGAPPAPEVAERLLLEALERGVTLFDTAALYGFGANETCKTSIRCGRATPNSALWRPAANSASPLSPSARWRVPTSPARCAT